MASRTDWPEDPELRAKLVAILRYEQFTPADGTTPEDIGYRKGWNARAESLARQLESGAPLRGVPRD